MNRTVQIEPVMGSLMPRALVAALIVAAVVDTLEAMPRAYGDVKLPRDPFNRDLPTRAEYLEQFPESPLHLYRALRSELRRDQAGTVVLVVNHNLYTALSDDFEQWVDDLAGDDWSAVLLDVEGGSPEELKDLVVMEGGEDLAGVIFVGQLSLAWFEQYEHFDDEEIPDHNRLVQYPIDLFYMDLDGEWGDTSGNGVYDVHTGAWEPDIWLGRLAGYNLSRLSEQDLIAGYLERLRAWRRGQRGDLHRALNFIDDDWAEWAGPWGQAMRLTYGGTTVVAHPETTSARIYGRELESGMWEMVQVAAHSSYDAHYFRIENRSRLDYFRFSDLRDRLTPQARFYNLFACSVMNLAAGNLCLGALYTLKGPYALGVIGTTKLGSMLFFEDYYYALAEGATFGEAFRHWFALHGREPGHPNWARSWFYGMTYFGDPTLRPVLGPRVAGVEFADFEGGDADGRPEAGETLTLSLWVKNRGDRALSSEVAIGSFEPEWVQVEGRDTFRNLAPGDSVRLEFNVRLNRRLEDQHRAVCNVLMTPDEGQPWEDEFLFEIGAPSFNLVGVEIAGEDGAWVSPGRRGRLTLHLANRGGDDLRQGADLRLEGLTGGVDVVSGVWDMPETGVGEVGHVTGIELAIDRTVPPGSAALMIGEVTWGGLSRGQFVLGLPTAEDLTYADELGTPESGLRSYAVSIGYRNPWRWGEELGDGSAGWAVGGPDTTRYPAHTDAALELPAFAVSGDVLLTFRHRMDAEAGWDGGVVEFNTGGLWQRAQPEDGYNGEAEPIGDFPGGPCWNGTFDWRDETVLIQRVDGFLGLRFRFAADNYVEGTGWAVDWVNVTGRAARTGEARAPVLDSFGLLSAYPNPFNAGLHVKFYAGSGRWRLIVYDLEGRVVLPALSGDGGAGLRSIALDGSKLTSGVFVIALSGEEGSDYLKVALIK